MIRWWSGQDGRTRNCSPLSMTTILQFPLGWLLQTFWRDLGLPRRKQVEQQKRFCKSPNVGLSVRSKKQPRKLRMCGPSSTRKKGLRKTRIHNQETRGEKRKNKFELRTYFHCQLSFGRHRLCNDSLFRGCTQGDFVRVHVQCGLRTCARTMRPSYVCTYNDSECCLIMAFGICMKWLEKNCWIQKIPSRLGVLY